ncbi:MAG: DNA mismatch repair endonuclease MutL [Colwellia sp.]
MTIAILPARLANQIAAGEVVERPASVIKELIENSLDAGATTINIDVDKGGVKRIRIADNGKGIVKDELMLALSRHATSKIKDLSDLEAINSLGFRGEALASISSVARLTLTSKPKEQDAAWQAYSEGRDMQVTVKPAAHPNGTTIEVLDLFFNTPARRKFLRTEKTEFAHIDEVVRRIALARFDVAFILTHNGKMVRQYRKATDKAGYAKRVGMVCGQKFIEHAIEVECVHDDMTFSGWLAKPSFARTQNDLCYSYVNGRMMRDKLINHAIRQAYADLLPKDTYPAFVLFLTLDHREVDVNVHPAKHEVRFHQSRYVHDFIYSVCHKALLEETQLPVFENGESAHQAVKENYINDPSVGFTHNSAQISQHPGSYTQSSQIQGSQTQGSIANARPDYIKPLEQVNHQAYQHIHAQTPGNNFPATFSSSASNTASRSSVVSNKQSLDNYQSLMTPLTNEEVSQGVTGSEQSQHQAVKNVEEHSVYPKVGHFFLSVENEQYGLFKKDNKLQLLSLASLSSAIQSQGVLASWQRRESGLVSQPLLLPIVINLDESAIKVIDDFASVLTQAGIVFVKQSTKKIQIRQFPACLRENDVSYSVNTILKTLSDFHTEKLKQQENNSVEEMELAQQQAVCAAIGELLAPKTYTDSEAQQLYLSAKTMLSEQLFNELLLKSAVLDLTSAVKQLSS